MKDDIKALRDNGTWNLERPPTDRDAIPGKWVRKGKLGLSSKHASDNFKGFKQVEGRDYFETFLPTCKPELSRILFQLWAQKRYVMRQFHVKTAFLLLPIEKVYLEQPKEFVKLWFVRGKLVYWLNKSKYRSQANNNWCRELAKRSGVH